MKLSDLKNKNTHNVHRTHCTQKMEKTYWFTSTTTEKPHEETKRNERTEPNAYIEFIIS